MGVQYIHEEMQSLTHAYLTTNASIINTFKQIIFSRHHYLIQQTYYTHEVFQEFQENNDDIS